MKKIKNVICEIFKMTHKIGNKFIRCKDNDLLMIVFVINLIIMSVCLYRIINISTLNIEKIILIITFIINFFIFFVYVADENLLSVSGFLCSGIIYYLCIVIFSIFFIQSIDFKLGIVTGLIIGAVYWWFYSLIANNKVATVANEIISSIFGILILLKDTYITMTPASVLEQTDIFGYTYEKSIEIIPGMIFSPLLAINIIALLLCVLKGYWIEKYNNNQDVGYEYTDSKSEKNYKKIKKYLFAHLSNC